MTTPEDLLHEIRRAQAAIAAYNIIIDECKAGLAVHRDLGNISDTFVADNIQATWQERKSWSYSPAIKALQQSEQLEGIATQKSSFSWTIRELKEKAE